MQSADIASDQPAFRTRFNLKQLLVYISLFCLLVACLRTPFLQARNNQGHSEWLRASPFTKVSLNNDTAEVEFNEKVYELVSINGKTTRQILTSSRRRYGSSMAEKRFIEDLPAVLGGLGLSPDATSVDLVLRDSTGKTTEVQDAPMTAENRARVYVSSGRSPAIAGRARDIAFLVFVFAALFGNVPSRIIAAMTALRARRSGKRNSAMLTTTNSE